MTAESYLKGEVPVVRVHRVDLAARELAKYQQVWGDIPNYGDKSPGLEGIDQFLQVVRPTLGSSILDIGCGSGVAGLKLEEMGFRLSYLDITDAALDPRVNRKRFIQLPLWKPLGSGLYFESGYCCDVLEHIAPEFTMLSVHNVLRACGAVFFQIALTADEFGKAIGQPLHLTVQDFNWWRDRLGEVGKLREARDLGGKAVYLVTR